jgi:hypothetical protein
MVILFIPAHFLLLAEAALIFCLAVKSTRNTCVLENVLWNVRLAVSIMMVTNGSLGWLRFLLWLGVHV